MVGHDLPPTIIQAFSLTALQGCEALEKPLSLHALNQRKKKSLYQNFSDPQPSQLPARTRNDFVKPQYLATKRRFCPSLVQQRLTRGPWCWVGPFDPSELPCWQLQEKKLAILHPFQVLEEVRGGGMALWACFWGKEAKGAGMTVCFLCTNSRIAQPEEESRGHRARIFLAVPVDRKSYLNTKWKPFYCKGGQAQEQVA